MHKLSVNIDEIRNEVNIRMEKSYVKLATVMKRAELGEELTIGFLGGSITQGSLASSDVNTYAYLTYKWFCDTFPKANFHYVNAGIGGTSSHFGVARMQEDVLMYRPDVLFIDFTVNDDATVFFQETYEGVLRKAMKSSSHPALFILNNVYYETGVNAQAYHNMLADYYSIPYVSVKDTIRERMLAGEFSVNDISPDGLHPNDRGHALVSAEIVKVLEIIRQKANEESVKTQDCAAIPKPMTDNAYEDAIRYTIRNLDPGLEGFRADTDEKKGHLDFFKNGWIAFSKGDRLTADFNASCIAVQYRKSPNGGSPVARLVLDGDEKNAVILDGNFEETWGDCLYIQPVLHHGERKKHHVEIEITNADDVTKAFYLISFITA